jgi:hypothetical protein
MKISTFNAPKVTPRKHQPAFVRITWDGLFGRDSAVYPADQKDSALAYFAGNTTAQVIAVTGED